MSQMIPITARISQKDMEFLASLDIEGVKSTGEKIRYLLNEASIRRKGYEDYDSAIKLIGDIVGKNTSYIKKTENETGLHSEFMEKLSIWLLDTMAVLVSAIDEEKTKTKIGSKDWLRDIEKVLGNKVFLLLESVLRMGVTKTSSNYNPELIWERIGPILELCEVVSETYKRNSGGK